MSDRYSAVNPTSGGIFIGFEDRREAEKWYDDQHLYITSPGSYMYGCVLRQNVYKRVGWALRVEFTWLYLGTRLRPRGSWFRWNWSIAWLFLLVKGWPMWEWVPGKVIRDHSKEVSNGDGSAAS